MYKTKKPSESFKRLEPKSTVLEFAKYLAKARAAKMLGDPQLIDKSLIDPPSLKFDEQIEREALIYGPAVRVCL